jgi:hypothetical protein
MVGSLGFRTANRSAAVGVAFPRRPPHAIPITPLPQRAKEDGKPTREPNS